MRRTTSVLTTWLALTVLLLASNPAGAILPPDRTDLTESAFRRDDLYVRNVLRTIDQMPAVERLGLQAALTRLGASPSGAFYDARAGAWGTLVLRQALVPGAGAGNDLSWADLGLAAPAGEAELRAAVWQALAAFLSVHQADLGISVAELGAPRTTLHEDGRIVQIHVQRRVGGVPVRDSFLTAVVNGGNLILLGTKNWGAISVGSSPSLSSDAAADAVEVFAAPHQIAGSRRPAELLFVPLALGAEPGDAATGEGLDYALAWALYPAIAGGGSETWEALVDAHSGEMLAFRDANQYFDRSMTGGVLPVSNDGLSPNGVPDGIEQPGFPMPFADVIQPFGTSTITNSSGLADDIGSVLRTTLAGPFVRMNDLCGPIDEVAVCGDLDLGLGAGADCQVPAGRSPGDTRSSRTGFFEVNRIVEQAKSWIPANAWLGQQLTANMNLDNSCNAFWNGDTINFYTSGVSGSNTCRNTGEIAAVFDHEWGHGMDDNDGNGEISRPGEAYADIAAVARLADSCVGRGFFENNSLGGLCTGFGDACLECSGVRDADWLKRSSGLPHDIAWILQTTLNPGVPGVAPGGGCVGATVPLPTLSDGPCGQSTHCEGNVVSEVVWDLLQRDLRCHGNGWENVPGDGSGPVGGGQCVGGAAPTSDVNTTLNAIARIFYESGGAIQEWFTCDASGVAAGCNPDSGYMNFLAVDDDNGDLMDGTPHFSAIDDAYRRHDMSCQPFAAAFGADSGCVAPLATPSVTGVASQEGATISWSPVAGASEYWVFRTDGIHGCEFGKERVAITTGTEHTDTGLLAGREYFYTVEAVGANGSCRSAASACETVVPDAESGATDAVLAFREVADAFEIVTGDQDEFLDNCEEAVFRFQVENAGDVDLTNVRITAVGSPSHPGISIATPLPAGLGELATADCGLHGTAEAAFEFVAQGLGFDDELILEFTVDADQLSQPLVGTVALSGTESDFQLTASRTFSFEDDFELWRTVSGGYTRQSPGADGTFVHLASSALQSGACDEIQSPEIKLTAGSELSLHTNFVTEPGSPTFYDRANVGLFDVASGDRVTIDPDSGQLYNASGSGSVCVTANQNGWAGVGGGFLESGWSATALDAAARAGQRLRLDVAYGTDPLVEGLGFQFDEVTLTNFELQVPDQHSDSCPVEPNNSPVAVDDSDVTDENVAVTIPVLANDSDPDGDPITLDSVTQPANGTATANPGDGTVTYTPDPGFTGTDVFSYTISDDQGAEATGIVSVEVRPEGGGPGDDECDLCVDGKPSELTLTYRGGSCAASDNSQGSKADCEDLGATPPDDAPVFVIASDSRDADDDSDSDREWFRGEVAPDEPFTLEAANGGKDHFGSKLFVHVYDGEGGNPLQTVEIHTSCSAPLFEGERFGSLESGDGDPGTCEAPSTPSGRVHGSGFLAGLASSDDDSDSDSDKINFSFDAKFKKGVLKGKLKLRDKTADVEIDARQIDSLSTGDGTCNGAATGAGAFEFTATGSFESGGVETDDATFRVCGEDNGKHGKGKDDQPADRLFVECLSGCAYDTAARTADDGIDGGNIHLHDPIVGGEEGGSGDLAGSDPDSGGGAGGTGGGSATADDPGVLAIGPMLSLGTAGTPQLLTVQLDRPLGADFEQQPLTLHWRDALGVSGSLPGLTDNFGLAVFVATVQPGDTEYWVSAGELDSNRVEIRGLD